jgi:RNA recognition motif-containing protein
MSDRLDMPLDAIVKSSREKRPGSSSKAPKAKQGSAQGAKGGKGERRPSGGRPQRRDQADRRGGDRVPYRGGSRVSTAPRPVLPRSNSFALQERFDRPYRGDIDVSYGMPAMKISASFGGSAPAVEVGPAGSRVEISLKGTTIALTNLAPEADDDAIREILSMFGKVKKVEVERDEAGNSVGCAEAVFTSFEDAKKAVAGLDGRIADGRKLRVQITSAPPTSKAPEAGSHNPVASAMAALGEADAMGGYSRARGREPRAKSDYSSQRERPRGGRDADRNPPRPAEHKSKPKASKGDDLEAMLDSYMSGGKGDSDKPASKKKDKSSKDIGDVDGDFEAYIAQRGAPRGGDE